MDTVSCEVWMSVDVLMKRRRGINPPEEATGRRHAAAGRSLERKGWCKCSVWLM